MAEEGRSYSQVVADGQSTVTFASALVDLVGRPLSGLWSKQSAAADYRARLGEWAAEAVDANGRWLQPVLRVAAFEDHLVRVEGRPKPSGLCQSSLAWGQLLYALNIRPGMGVLAWRLPPKAVDPGVEGVRLVVDGAAMCHIVNLFRIYEDAAPASFSPGGHARNWSRGRDEENICKFPFGTISVDCTPVGRPRDIKFVATFEPGSHEDLERERLPFSYNDWFLPGTHLTFESSSLMAKYLYGVHNQVPVADTASIGALPAPDDSLKKRAEYYVRSTKLLRSDHECEPRCEKSCIRLWDGHTPCTEHCNKECDLQSSIDWSKPRLVTRVWLDEIERIKRRVTTNGGDDTGFLDFVMKSLEERPQFVQDVKQTLTDFGYPESASGDQWRLQVRGILKARLMFTDDHILPYWNARSESASVLYERLNSMTLAQLHDILADLAVNRDSGWFHQLSSLTDEVENMLCNLDDFRNVPVLVLELGPSHCFWQGMFEIKGE
ncbi:hypothetical protein BHE90_011865 [Fusarium euwallaceae]|uniref:Uncharacterized protein n=3 Tax=Fusarium solani species complex TaxID=232080 RepID=A0A3M2RX16_9HYPO|nr:hypothetical protein CDV36_010551 [Fusarium kuroshium]RSM05205.1 hypothetical protein CEP52_006369 [Fusarium oligoseptatum]RTE73725.1 hypothetical protein BHE90_011865 [Fusarium euwallaceae]